MSEQILQTSVICEFLSPIGSIQGTYRLRKLDLLCGEAQPSCGERVWQPQIPNRLHIREDKSKFIDDPDRLITSKMFVDDTISISLADMRAKARRLRSRKTCSSSPVIDYLQLMTGSARSSQKKFKKLQLVIVQGRTDLICGFVKAKVSPIIPGQLEKDGLSICSGPRLGSSMSS